jgi:hypothetical protein
MAQTGDLTEKAGQTQHTLENPSKGWRRDRSKTMDEGCLEEIQAFSRGGIAGLARLKLVLPSLFAYYQIIGLEHQAMLLSNAGLCPARDGVHISFELETPSD